MTQINSVINSDDDFIISQVINLIFKIISGVLMQDAVGGYVSRVTTCKSIVNRLYRRSFAKLQSFVFYVFDSIGLFEMLILCDNNIWRSISIIFTERPVILKKLITKIGTVFWVTQHLHCKSLHVQSNISSLSSLAFL